MSTLADVVAAVRAPTVAAAVAAARHCHPVRADLAPQPARLGQGAEHAGVPGRQRCVQQGGLPLLHVRHRLRQEIKVDRNQYSPTHSAEYCSFLHLLCPKNAHS